MKSDPVSLEIPCSPEYVALCRLVAGSLGLREGLGEDVVADLKVIVTEACNCFLALAGDAPAGAGTPPSGVCSLRMEFDPQPDRFVISVFYPHKRSLLSWLETRDPLGQAGLGLTILRALSDDIEEAAAGDGTVLRLTKRLPA